MSAKRMKISEDVSEEDLKGMMQLVPLEEVYVEDLQVKHPIIDWEIHSEGQREYWKIIRLGGHTAATKDKEKELWVELKRLFEPDFEDQLWTHNQAFMHDPLEWKLYDTCGVHHVFPNDQEMFMLVEKDYPLRKGLAIVMICNKLQVEQYSQMANDLILNINSIASKFDGKADKVFFVGYSLNSKAFRVFNSRTRIVEENLHVRVNVVGTNISIDLLPDPNMLSLEDIGIFEDSHDDEDVFGAEVDFYNLDSTF
nr:retrovirus-related Pol polyprotein from transposon TNT 1-94 [Tanacetum cinerariifolium]